MRSIVLVVVSAAEPNHRYLSPISGRAEHHSLNTYETVKLCKRSMMGEVEGPIGLSSAVYVLVETQEHKGVCCAQPVVRRHVFSLMCLVGCFGSGK